MPYSANDYVVISSAQNCGGTGSGHGLQVWSRSSAPGGHAGGYWFSAPAATSITGLSFTGDFSGWDGWVSHWATSTDGSGDLADPCASYSTNCNSGLEYGTGSQSTAVNNASEIGFAIWCHASPCPPNDGRSIFGPAGSANVYWAQITVNEPDPPSVSAGGNLWSAGGQWISGAAEPAGYWSVGYGASDPAGPCALQALIVNGGGGWVQSDTSNNVSPDYTQAAPCGASGRGTYWWSPNIAALANGTYYLHVQADNPAGMWSDQAVTLNVDNQPPPPVTNLTASSSAMGPAGWSSSPDFTLRWTGQPDYPGAQSPISTTNVSVAAVSSAQQSASQTTANVTVGSAPGGYSASVWEQDQAGNQASPQSVALYYDPSKPSAPSFGPGRATWIGSSGTQLPETLSATAGGPSGVYGYSVSVDGTPSTSWHSANVKADAGGNGSFSISNLADGMHQLCAVAFSGAGVAGPEACTTIRIDRQPPTTTISSDTPQAQTAWVNHPVTLTVSCADQPGLSGCQSVSYQLDGGAVTTETGSSASVVVSGSGAHTLSAWSTDNAGNVGQAISAQALVDVSAPQGFFEPQSPSEPQQLAVAAADPYSGVAGGQIQLQINGSWTALQTSYDNAGQLTAIAPDDQLPRGSWAVRAIVWNAVGNQAVITAYADGVAVTHQVPARVQTTLRVGRTLIATRSCRARISALRARRLHGRLARNQRPAARLRHSCTTRLIPARTANVRLSAPRGLVVHGQLELASGQPVSGQRVRDSFEAVGWTERQLGATATDARGRFVFTLPPGASGTVTFTFSGSDELGDAQARITTQVRGEVLARVASGLVGRGGASILRVSGRLVGGYVPQGGVQIQPEYIELGQPTLAWAPFGAPIYTDRRGRWSREIPISPDAAGRTYLLRFVVNRQSGWPFGATVSGVFRRRL